MLTQTNIASLADASCFESARRWRRDAEHLRDNADAVHLTAGQRARLLREAEAADRQATAHKGAHAARSARRHGR